jgi:hypothetical protein
LRRRHPGATEQEIYGAIRLRRSFNVIHLATMFEVDIFVRKWRPYDQAQLERRLLHQLDLDYLRYWAVQLGITDLLESVLNEVRPLLQ